jgi:hypothetical protein
MSRAPYHLFPFCQEEARPSERHIHSGGDFLFLFLMSVFEAALHTKLSGYDVNDLTI